MEGANQRLLSLTLALDRRQGQGAGATRNRMGECVVSGGRTNTAGAIYKDYPRRPSSSTWAAFVWLSLGAVVKKDRRTSQPLTLGQDD